MTRTFEENIAYVRSFFPEANVKQDKDKGCWNVWRRDTQEPLEKPLALGSSSEIAWANAAEVADNKEKSFKVEINNLTFSEALNALLAGALIRRSSWVTNAAWLVYVPASEIKASASMEKMLLVGTKILYEAHIDIFTRQGDMSSWIPSIQEILANDWELIS